ncbi:hypothetical protein GCM10007879_03270 [Maritalea porphyrae]|uniref:Uncharacterized protein n=1 Tax=Maritalea porphyrae TaxID=880732 RepID=A0ABQ5ULD7_9HYPH|nr:hypothetical protein GCM10007879_03270 [Maritalea porphyrae]
MGPIRSDQNKFATIWQAAIGINPLPQTCRTIERKSPKFDPTLTATTYHLGNNKNDVKKQG